MQTSTNICSNWLAPTPKILTSLVSASLWLMLLSCSLNNYTIFSTALITTYLNSWAIMSGAKNEDLGIWPSLCLQANPLKHLNFLRQKQQQVNLIMTETKGSIQILRKSWACKRQNIFKNWWLTTKRLNFHLGEMGLLLLMGPIRIKALQGNNILIKI